MKIMWRVWLRQICLVFVPAFLIYDAVRRHDP